jgi:hypothetical protein
MKLSFILAGVAALGVFALSMTGASADTCKQAAAWCIKKGGSRASCNAPIAECRRTCIYIAPSGRRWPASGDCKTKS